MASEGRALLPKHLSTDAMFFGTPAFRSPYLSPRHAAPRDPPPPERRLEPNVKVQTTHDAYLVHLLAPEGVTLSKPSASAERHSSIVLEGVLIPSQRGAYVYQCRRQVACYGEPSNFAPPVEFLPPGSCVRGSAPSRHGWIGLESDLDDDEPLYLRDDGGLVLLQRPTRTQPQPFARHLDLPADAVLDRASCTKMRGCEGYVVTVPRGRRPQTHPPAWQPTAAATSASKAQANELKAKRHPASPPPKGMNANKENHTARPSTTSSREIAGGSRDVLRTTLEPVLQECSVSPENVSTPSETVQHWVATANGGFVKAAAAGAA